MTTKEGVYIPGDWFLLCDVCGFKKRRSETLKRWDGAMVCREDYEERHPLDMVQPRADRQNVLDARYAEPVYVTAATQYLDLPGTLRAYAETPDSAALDITGDIDFRFRFDATDYTTSKLQVLVSKWIESTDQRSFYVGVTTAGTISLAWTTNGTGATLQTVTLTPTTPFTDGVAAWMRVTLDVDNGAGGKTATLYTSTDGGAWTSNDVDTSAGTTSIFAGSAPLQFNGTDSALGSAFTGRLYSMSIYSGTTLAASFDADDADYPGARSVTSALTGEVYTLIGNVSINAVSGGGVQPSDL